MDRISYSRKIGYLFYIKEHLEIDPSLCALILLCFEEYLIACKI